MKGHRCGHALAGGGSCSRMVSGRGKCWQHTTGKSPKRSPKRSPRRSAIKPLSEADFVFEGFPLDEVINIWPTDRLKVIDGRDDSFIYLRGPKKPWTVRAIIQGMANHPHYQGDQGDYRYLEEIHLVRPGIIRTTWGN